MVLKEQAGGVRVSDHVPDAASHKQDVLVRLGSRRDAIAPLWQGITVISDEVTRASHGEIKLTAVLLHAVKILRTDAFRRIEVQFQ